MSVELFNGLVSPEIAGVLDEAMRAMPDSAVHVTPGRYGSGRVHVSIGGGSYDLSLTIDGGDRVASLELVPVGGRTGNAVAVLRAGLGVLAAAEGTDTRDVWILDEGCEARWDKITGRLVIECEHTCGQPGSIRSIDAIKQNPGDDRWVVTVETTGEPYWFEFDKRPSAVNFAAWLGGRIREGGQTPISSAAFVEYVHQSQPSAKVVIDQQEGSRNAVTVWLGAYVLFVYWRTGFCEWSIGRIGGGRVYDLRAGSPLEGLETLQRLASMAPLKGE